MRDSYRAVDKQGKTLESLFQTQCGIAAAMAFFRKAFVTASTAGSIADHSGDFAERDARQTARMHGVSVYVWKDGKIVALKP